MSDRLEDKAEKYQFYDLQREVNTLRHKNNELEITIKSLESRLENFIQNIKMFIERIY
jgi:hypothetical protein